MRCFGKPKAEVSRSQRRAQLALLLAWSTVPLGTAVLGDNVLGGDLGAQEPVIAAPTIQLVAGVTSNPYVKPVETTFAEIQLASSGDASAGAVRLVPVGRAVGLHPIADSQSPRPVGPSMTIDPVQPAPVRANPMATQGRQPTLKLERVDNFGTSTENRRPETSAGKNQVTQPSSATLMMSMIPSTVTPTDTSRANNGSVIQQTGNDETNLGGFLKTPSLTVRATTPIKFDDMPPSAQETQAAQSAQSPQRDLATSNIPPAEASPVLTETRIAMNRVEPGSLSVPVPPAPEEVGVVQESEAIVFSLSDDAQAVSVDLLPDFEEDDEVIITETSETISDAINLSLSDSPTSEFGQEVEPIVSEAIPMMGIRPLPSSPGDVVAMEDVISEASEDSANELLRRNRYRAPVDVTSVPVAIERLMNAADESSTVAAVEDVVAEIMSSMDLMEPNQEPQGLQVAEAGNGVETQSPQSILHANPLPPQPKLQLPEGMKAIPLHLNFAQVRSLTLGGSLKDIRVIDQNICQAVATGSNQIKLIGTGNGVTQLVVWAEVDDADNPTRMQAFEIHVDSHENSTVADDSLGMLSQSIQQTFPNSQVQLDGLGDRVRISGRCLSEDSAKKILRMVRRTCLIPVEDNLEVR